MAAAAALCASTAIAARASTGTFTTSEYVSAGQGTSSLARADNLFGNSAACKATTTTDSEFVNFKTTGEPGRMHFPGWTPFPVAEPHKDHNFAMHISGQVEIPQAGAWTFGVKSNGGFHLQIGDESMQRKASSGSSNKITPMIFEQAGTYSVDLTYYEKASRATLELFASKGRFSRFGAHGADWHLVGDTADGGLALTDDSTPLPSAESDPSTTADDAPSTGVTSAANDTSVPEPGGFMMALAAAPWLLGRRWRRRQR